MIKLAVMRLSLAIFTLAIAFACGAQQPSIDDQARAIEREVWSPYCPGRLLIDCTTRQARELRSEIEDRLERGERPDQVLEWIRRNHGSEALARPDARGLGLAVWLVPAAIFAAGAVTVGSLVRRWTKRAARMERSDSL